MARGIIDGDVSIKVLRVDGDLRLTETQTGEYSEEATLHGRWGDISGTLSNQTDLQNALDAKADTEDIPTAVSQLENDSGYITASDTVSYQEHIENTDIHCTVNDKEKWSQHMTAVVNASGCLVLWQASDVV